MSDFVTVEDMKRVLAECPICTEYFDDKVRVPQRLHCCTQSICEPCLETYSKGRQTISCPICRQQQHLEGGVKSLQKEKLILRFLDHLKAKRNPVPPFTDCPDNNTAIAKCDTCSIFLCHECLKAHSRHRTTRGHTTTTFKQAKVHHLERKTSLSHEQPYRDSKQMTLVEKAKQLDKRIEKISSIKGNVTESTKITVAQINKSFDDLSRKLEQRRKDLIAEVVSKSKNETSEINKIIDSHATIKMKLEKASEVRQSSSSVSEFLELSPKDTSFNRRGFSFSPHKMNHLSSLIQTSGLVRRITFTSAEKRKALNDLETCDTVTLEPAHYPEVSDTCVNILSENGLQEVRKTSTTCDQIVVMETSSGIKHITCPYLEFDHNTASDDIITTSGPVITTREPAQTIPPTGCRMQSPRHVFLSRPLEIESDQRILIQTKNKFTLKKEILKLKMIFHISFCSSPDDIFKSQRGEFVLEVGTCSHREHKNNVCIYTRSGVAYSKDCIPIASNKVAATGSINVLCLLDGENHVVHIFDGETLALLSAVNDVSFDKPVWPLMYLGRPEWTDMTAEVISGSRIHLSAEIYRVLTTI